MYLGPKMQQAAQRRPAEVARSDQARLARRAQISRSSPRSNERRHLIRPQRCAFSTTALASSAQVLIMLQNCSIISERACYTANCCYTQLSLIEYKKSNFKSINCRARLPTFGKYIFIPFPYRKDISTLLVYY